VQVPTQTQTSSGTLIYLPMSFHITIALNFVCFQFEHSQEQKSVRNLCSEIARTGDVSSCPYKDKCRFSHDLEAFKAQVRTIQLL